MSVIVQLLGPGNIGEFLAVLFVTVGVFAAVFGLGVVLDRFF